MSNGVYLWLTCREEHRKTFEEMGFEVEEEYGDGSVCMFDERATWAYDGELRALAGKGIPFYAENDVGEDFGYAGYACDGERFVWVEYSYRGRPVVEVDDDGTPDAEQLANVRDYYDVLAAAKKGISTDA